MQTLRRTALPVAALALLAGCARPGGETAGGQPNPPSRRPAATASPSASPAEAAGPYPSGGIRVTTERGDAAAGYREMTLQLRNCGDRPVTVAGRADVVVLGKDQDILAVDVVASQHYPKAPAAAVTVKPGDGTMAVLAWRNTYTASDVPPVVGVYLSVALVKDGPRQLVKVASPLDLGNTGRLELSAWLIE